MKATFTIGFMVLILTVSNVKAQDSPHSVNMKVGETFSVCKSGLVICPVRTPICDDTTIITLVNTPDGLGFKGVAPGTTLCSVATAGARRLFQITVH